MLLLFLPIAMSPHFASAMAKKVDGYKKYQD